MFSKTKVIRRAKVSIGTRTNLIENVITNASGKFHLLVIGI